MRSFLFKFTDIDQALLWCAARELLAGRLHEPCFYGQAYNSWIEAFFALPLLIFGVPFGKALPIVSSLAFTVSVAVLVRLVGKKSLFGAAVLLGALLTLPQKYQIIASIPRGFIPGIFVASLGLGFFHWIKTEIRFFALSFLLVFGMVLNPNAFPVALIGVYLLLESDLNSPRTRKLLFLGAVCGLIPYVGAKLFYGLHPEYILHNSNILHFSFSNYAVTLPTFKWILRPISFGESLWLMGLLFILLVYCERAKRRTFFIYGAILGSLVVFFGMDKAFQSFFSLFLPEFRVLIGYPLFFAWAFGHVISPQSEADRAGLEFRLVRATGVLLIVLGIVKGVSLISFDFANQTERDLETFQPLESVYRRCSELESMARQNNTDLVVLAEEGGVGYACAALYPELKTLLVSYERRTWRIEEEASIKRKRFIATNLKISEKEALQKAGLKIIDLAPDTSLIESPEPATSLSALVVIGRRFRGVASPH